MSTSLISAVGKRRVTAALAGAAFGAALLMAGFSGPAAANHGNEVEDRIEALESQLQMLLEERSTVRISADTLADEAGGGAALAYSDDCAAARSDPFLECYWKQRSLDH
jgi:hypothetical protein